MNRAKTRITTTDAEIDAAIALAALREPYRPKAVAATYRAQDDATTIPRSARYSRRGRSSRRLG